LVPKKAKDFIPLVAKELGIDQDLVDEIVSVYWKEVRKALSELQGNRVNVVNFGVFATRRHKMLELEKKYSFFVEERKDVKTFRRYAVLKETQSRLDAIRRLLSELEKDKLKKETVKNKRDAEKTKNNLEEPKGDIPGNKE
jgi:nucleoid DNA-binding protein